MKGNGGNGNNHKEYEHSMVGSWSKPIAREDAKKLRRRTSMDEKTSSPREYLINVEHTKNTLLAQEDTNGDFQVTIHDTGPKAVKLSSVSGHGRYEVRGTYAISNLLQELALASDRGHRTIRLTEMDVHEPPVQRLNRRIREHFWPGLTRRIDADGLELICLDPKDRTFNPATNGHHASANVVDIVKNHFSKALEISHSSRFPARIYVPYSDVVGLNYYIHVASTRPNLSLEVIRLPSSITPAYVKSINEKPGILSLALRTEWDPREKLNVLRGNPFVVPGGRFNEMYGWDSYFEVLGLLADGYVELSKSMVENMVYQVHHYGKILNANRTYYLTRSQPPFLTDMILVVWRRICEDSYSVFGGSDEKAKQWLAACLCAAIAEYYNVWMKEPRFVAQTGLSRFYGQGLGMPPETESSHFNVVLAPFAEKHGLDINTFSTLYNNGTLVDADLDAYFMHDRAVRESGHDTTYRLDGKAAYLVPVDLNCLLYKYELDIAKMIRDNFGDCFTYDPQYCHNLMEMLQLDLQQEIPQVFSQSNVAEDHLLHLDSVQHSLSWFQAAEHRRIAMEKYLWNAETGLYHDYDFELGEQNAYEAVNGMCYPLWCGLLNHDGEKAKKLIRKGLEKFEVAGGLVCGTEESRGFVGIARPNRQWDYPFGWAPHQMLAWKGLFDYGHEYEARRIIYRWLYMITKSFVDFNGVVPEKYDVVAMTHQVLVEYGNVGTEFKYVPREGFGWMNASYQLGLSLLTLKEKRALGILTSPEHLYNTSSTDDQNI